MIKCVECGQQLPIKKRACAHCGFSVSEIDGFTAWSPESAKAADGFKAEYFESLAALEAGHFWFRSRNALILWALKKYFPQPASFLEIGCGTGFVLSAVAKAFPSIRLVGAEIFTAGLTCAASRVPDAAFVQMDARRMPYCEEFDIAAAFDVIEHMKEDVEALRGLHAALKPGGGLLLTVPQHRWLWSKFDEYSCHVRRYEAADLHAKIHAAGFEIVRSTSFVSLLLPALLFSRRKAKQKASVGLLDEFKIARPINRLLEVILTAERGLIAAGLDFPLGGSRLVIARKITGFPSEKEMQNGAKHVV